MVIVEGSCIVVRKEAILENYQGGMSQFLFDLPDNNTVSVLRTHVAFFWICVKAKWVASDEAIILRSGCSFGSATWLEHL